MKIAAAEAIANTINDQNLTSDYVIPSVFDKEVVTRVADAVSRCAREQGAARKRT
jgi:malate dehydrogenase (oxaloacetate-decarboxylating)